MPRTKTPTYDGNIEVDPDGLKAGVFNDQGDPTISFLRIWDINGVRQPDGWLLIYRDSTGEPRSHVLGVTQQTAVEEALVAARTYLAENTP